MYVRVTPAGHGLCPGPRDQPRPAARHQAQARADCDHSDEQPGPQQIFAVNI